MDPKLADHIFARILSKKMFNHLVTKETSMKDHEGKDAFER